MEHGEAAWQELEGEDSECHTHIITAGFMSAPRRNKILLNRMVTPDLTPCLLKLKDKDRVSHISRGYGLSGRVVGGFNLDFIVEAGEVFTEHRSVL